MTIINLVRHMPYAADDLFRIVARVESYRAFVPLCEKSEVWQRTTDGNGRESFLAKLLISYPRLAIAEEFTSTVTADPSALTIDAVSRHGPLKHLDNRWTFAPAQGGTDVGLRIEFLLASRSLQFLLSGMLDYVLRRMLTAFEARAASLLKS